MKVVLNHPHGRVEIEYEEWVKKGPGKRGLLSPVELLNDDGNRLPIKQIPLRYRNTLLSRTFNST